MILAEIESKFLRSEAFNEESNDPLIYESLVLLDKIRKKANQREMHYKRSILQKIYR